MLSSYGPNMASNPVQLGPNLVVYELTDAYNEIKKSLDSQLDGSK